MINDTQKNILSYDVQLLNPRKPHLLWRNCPHNGLHQFRGTCPPHPSSGVHFWRAEAMDPLLRKVPKLPLQPVERA